MFSFGGTKRMSCIDGHYGSERQFGTQLARDCPYKARGTCSAFLDFLRENSADLAERTVHYFCEDHYVQCARFKALRAGISAEHLNRMGPWEDEAISHLCGLRVA
jgi:hypothetical protein